MSGNLSDQLGFALNSHETPTAIFATSDVLSVGVLRELQKRSIRIPDKMALISFDDFDAASLVRPAITVVRQPIIELGRKAASLLLDRLTNKNSSKSSQIELLTELIIRESCGCRAGRKRR